MCNQLSWRSLLQQIIGQRPGSPQLGHGRTHGHGVATALARVRCAALPHVYFASRYCVSRWNRAYFRPNLKTDLRLVGFPIRILNNTSRVWLKSPKIVSHDRRPTTLFVGDVIGWCRRNQPQRHTARKDAGCIRHIIQ